MRSGHSTWRPLFRTTERSWPLKTLPRRSSPPLLATQWVGQVRNEPTAPPSSWMFFALHLSLSLHLTTSSSCACRVLTWLFHPFFLISFLASLSILIFPPPPPHHTCFFPRVPLHPAHSVCSPSTPTLTDEYQTAGPGSPRHPTDFKHSRFLHFLQPHSTLLCSSLLVSAPFLCSYCPVNISSHVKWQLQCVRACARVKESSFANTSEIPPTNSSSRMSSQHSYQSMMNRMANVSYLVLPTCSSSDRSAAALKSIQNSTFPLYWIPTHVLFWQGKHSTIPHHSVSSLSDLSVLVCFIEIFKFIQPFYPVRWFVYFLES